MNIERRAGEVGLHLSNGVQELRRHAISLFVSQLREGWQGCRWKSYAIGLVMQAESNKLGLKTHGLGPLGPSAQVQAHLGLILY